MANTPFVFDAVAKAVCAALDLSDHYFSRKMVLAQFVSENCVPVIGSTLLIGGVLLAGSTYYACNHDKSLYRAYLIWCEKSGCFPIDMATFFQDIVFSINYFLKWHSIYSETTINHESNYREDRIFGIAYKDSEAANHG